MSFHRAEAFALGGLMIAWQRSNLQLRRPSWNRPTFWSRCLTQQIARPLPAGSAMQTFLTVKGLLGYIAVVDQLVMTIVGPMAGSGIRFQVLMNGAPVPFTQYPVNVELGKEGSTTYPVIPRPWYLPVLETDTLEIQAENTGPLQRTVLAGTYGWYYSTIDSTSTQTDKGVTDATYGPVVGSAAP